MIHESQYVIVSVSSLQMCFLHVWKVVLVFLSLLKGQDWHLFCHAPLASPVWFFMQDAGVDVAWSSLTRLTEASFPHHKCIVRRNIQYFVEVGSLFVFHLHMYVPVALSRLSTRPWFLLQSRILSVFLYALQLTAASLWRVDLTMTFLYFCDSTQLCFPLKMENLSVKKRPVLCFRKCKRKLRCVFLTIPTMVRFFFSTCWPRSYEIITCYVVPLKTRSYLGPPACPDSFLALHWQIFLCIFAYSMHSCFLHHMLLKF